MVSIEPGADMITEQPREPTRLLPSIRPLAQTFVLAWQQNSEPVSLEKAVSTSMLIKEPAFKVCTLLATS